MWLRANKTTAKLRVGCKETPPVPEGVRGAGWPMTKAAAEGPPGTEARTQRYCGRLEMAPDSARERDWNRFFSERKQHVGKQRKRSYDTLINNKHVFSRPSWH